MINLELFCTGWQYQLTNRFQAGGKLSLANARVWFNTHLAENNLVRIYAGIAAEQVQVFQGYLSQDNISLTLAERKFAAAPTIAAHHQMIRTKAEIIEDILPLETVYIEPVDPGGADPMTIDTSYDAQRSISQPGDIIVKQGAWKLKMPRWYGHGTLPPLVLALESFPVALTGGGPVDLPEGVEGGPGACINGYESLIGSMFNDTAWVSVSPAIDMFIQASVRMGALSGQPNTFGFLSTYGPYVNATKYHNGQGLLTHVFYKDNLGNTDDVYQESTVVGLVFRAVHDANDPNGSGKKYIFVWEANSDLNTGTHLEDEAGRFWGDVDIYDKPDYGGLSVGQNKMYLIVTDFDESDENWQANEKWINRAVAVHSPAVQAGGAYDLRLQVLGGRVYCYYRPTAINSESKQPWTVAFDGYKVAHHSAGYVGLMGRGQNTILWDAFTPAQEQVLKCRNEVHFWDIHASDTIRNMTLEEIIRLYATRGHTKTAFRSLVDWADMDLLDGDFTTSSEPVENPTIDFTFTLADNGGEAGLFVRAIDSLDPTSGAVYLGFVVDDVDRNGSYVVKRRYLDGDEVATDYAPVYQPLEPGVKYSARVSVINEVFTVYLEGNYCGHFRDETKLGREWGIYATGSAATFHSVRLPELYEVPDNALQDVGQTMFDTIRNVIGHRAIKGVFQHDGSLLVSYFKDHDDAGTFEDALEAVTLQKDESYVNAVYVQGAYTAANYAHPDLQDKGRRFQLVNQPNLMTKEACINEAKRLVREAYEKAETAQFDAPPDLRLQPEDQLHLVVAEQNLDRDHLVDDIACTFNLKEAKWLMQVQSRRKWDL